jgi:sialic acid synthase SpsE
MYRPRYMKIPSARLTDDALLDEIRLTHAIEGTQAILSTGMSTLEEIDHAVSRLGPALHTLLHCCSAYPSPIEALNLCVIDTLRARYPVNIGYSSHSVSPWPALCAVARGATMIEAHLTLDRCLWGSDQSASLEPEAFRKLVEEIRTCEVALGDGIKKLEPCEVPVMKKLRRQVYA